MSDIGLSVVHNSHETSVGHLLPPFAPTANGKYNFTITLTNAQWDKFRPMMVQLQSDHALSYHSHEYVRDKVLIICEDVLPEANTRIDDALRELLGYVWA